MAYPEKIMTHFTHPQNMGTLNKSDKNIGTGTAGTPESGDVIRLQIAVDDSTAMITQAVFKAFGCGSSIAAASLVTGWLQYKSLEEACNIDHALIVEALDLPPVKMHCALLVEAAIKSAVKDYRSKQAQI